MGVTKYCVQESTLKIVRKGVRREFDLVGLIDVTLFLVLGRPPQILVPPVRFGIKYLSVEVVFHRFTKIFTNIVRIYIVSISPFKIQKIIPAKRKRNNTKHFQG